MAGAGTRQGGEMGEPVGRGDLPPDMVCVETMLDTLVAALILAGRSGANTNFEDALVYARQLRFKAEAMERYAREGKKA